MGKNVIITTEKILLKSRFYDLVIPKETVIDFQVREKQSGFGRAVTLEIKAERQKLVSRFFVGRIIYFYHKISGLPTHGSSLPNTFWGKKEVEKLLMNLLENGYPVETALTVVRQISHDEKTGELEQQCWQLMRQMMLLTFVSGIIIFVYMFFVGQVVLWWELILLVIGWAFICRVICWYIGGSKKS